MNDTDHYIWIRGTSTGIKTTFTIYGTDDGRKVKAEFSGFTYGKKRPEVTVTDPSLGPGTTAVQIEGQSFRSCTVKRTITYANGKTKTETFASEWPEYPHVIAVGVGTTTTTTTTPGKTTTTTAGKTTTSKPGSTTTAATVF